MAEIGLPGQHRSVLDGGDVDEATGRLLTVAELQAALVAAQAMAAARATMRPRLIAPSERAAAPLAATTQPPERDVEPATEPAVREAQEPAETEPAERPGRSRRWAPRWRAVAEATPPGPDETVIAAGRSAPAGFTGPAALRAWLWLTDTVPAPRVLVCAAGGGVGATTVVAALVGLMAAARPDQVLAVELARREFSQLTRQVCGAVDAVSVGGWLPSDVEQAPDLAGLPSGPSGARVVQAGAHWWPRLSERLTADTAVVADLGSLEHADTRALLLDHDGPAVMVARADSAGVTAALAALTELDAAGLTRRPVLVLCDAAGSRPGVLRTAQRLAATAADVLVLPKAPVLRRSPVPVGGWDRAVSGALAELVCALARTAHHLNTPPSTLRPLAIAESTHDEEHS
ncbi:hypothetical protein [Nakamurella endophytica]|uniref:Uncharacterized protein n=1 Tax=Nakamurella endophytica TaxID=1748367 RepID=A0A917T4E0_9ACTN|nr:hypothetical protein [Nakamurella endophytica]GGM09992.1 hypothetical protein GCM10011594_32380 [Nakamurella endophytica]